ncbi:MAG: sigma-70 family RNA polymerase sigma factor [Acidobacteria bacterium]|nr:MAG: sigma-70 family RNA polymerase sigma factor [Acidobacteriota bacterium]
MSTAAGNEPGEITRWLAEWAGGDEHALDRLLPAIYDELRGLASAYLERERRSHTLETSALVHEAFLRLLEQRHVAWESRRHFFAIAARMMRRILVDYARRRNYRKRGGRLRHLSLDEGLVPVEITPELAALDDALRDLAEVSPEQAQVVELRFFGGLRRREIAEILGLSEPTVSRRWRVARAWLFRHLYGEDRDGT